MGVKIKLSAERNTRKRDIMLVIQTLVSVPFTTTFPIHLLLRHFHQHDTQPKKGDELARTLDLMREERTKSEFDRKEGEGGHQLYLEYVEDGDHDPLLLPLASPSDFEFGFHPHAGGFNNHNNPITLPTNVPFTSSISRPTTPSSSLLNYPSSHGYAQQYQQQQQQPHFTPNFTDNFNFTPSTNANAFMQNSPMQNDTFKHQAQRMALGNR
ncbi:hypothetical protein H0H93_013383, partial [Arthromyces matolae]